MSLEFHASAADFLEAARVHLARDPVVSTVVATVADRAARESEAGVVVPQEDWWLVVRDDRGEVVGAGMRTAPFVPRPAFLLPMPAEDGVLLARALHERGERLGAVNGALPAVRRCAEETARLTGGRVAVAEHTRLFELGELTEPRRVAGRLRAAGESDLPRVSAWFAAFRVAADEQAGRPPAAHAAPDDGEVLRRIRDGRTWLWEDASGEVVHLTGANAPSLGVARIGPVYTPPEQRGRGWAGAAVAEVSRQLLADGARVCLFTDQANPVSNRLYERLGYRPVVDMTNLLVV